MRATSRDLGLRQPAHHQDYATQGRTERLIASARVILSLSGLITLWLDPTQPPRYESAYAFLAGYAVYSLALVALAWRNPLPSRWGVGVIHGIDLIVFTILIALFEGPAISPFFVFFVFSLFSATLRWNWQGCLWTAGAAIAAFAIVGLHEKEFVADEIVYLSVVAVVLAYMGAYEQQRRRQISALGAGPPSEAQDPIASSATRSSTAPASSRHHGSSSPLKRPRSPDAIWRTSRGDTGSPSHGNPHWRCTISCPSR